MSGSAGGRQVAARWPPGGRQVGPCTSFSSTMQKLRSQRPADRGDETLRATRCVTSGSAACLWCLCNTATKPVVLVAAPRKKKQV